MYITDKDKKLLQFIEKYKSITASQTSKIFFNNCSQSLFLAQRRLKKLYDNKIVKRYRENKHQEYIYYLDKPLTFHDTKVIDVIAELYTLNPNEIIVETEYRIPAGSKIYRADALIEVYIKDYLYVLLIEVDYTHHTSIQKLDDIYTSRHFQNKYSRYDIYPTTFIIKPYKVDNKYTDKEYDVYYDTFTLDNLISNLLVSS